VCRSVGHEGPSSDTVLTPPRDKSAGQDWHIPRFPHAAPRPHARGGLSGKPYHWCKWSGHALCWAFLNSPQLFVAFGGKCWNIFSTPLSRFFVFLFGLLESVSLDEPRQISFSAFASKRLISKVPTL
jgi:hypothetical protein